VKVTPILKLQIELEDREPAAFIRYLRTSYRLDLDVDNEALKVASDFLAAVEGASWDDYSFERPTH